MCSFYAYVYAFYDFTFCLSVLFSLFCKHVRLSCVLSNKLTYLLTTDVMTIFEIFAFLAKKMVSMATSL